MLMFTVAKVAFAIRVWDITQLGWLPYVVGQYLEHCLLQNVKALENTRRHSLSEW